MPPTSDVTVPVPEPFIVTHTLAVTKTVAVTFRAALIVTVHVPVPEQSPDQPEKAEPEEAAAVSVTSVPSAKLALHVAPQLMPATSEVTVPVPDPVFPTSSGYDAVPLNVAVAERAWSMVTTHVAALPEHAPDQLTRVCPDAGVAVSVTRVPAL